MIITLLGSGCSKGTPKIGCNCATCQLASIDKSQVRRRYGVLVQEGDLKILIDTGPDLKSQLLDWGIGFEHIDNVFLTHEHYDHIGGMGEFYASDREKPILLYGVDIRTTMERNRCSYLERKGYVLPVEIQPFQRIEIGSLTITPVPLNHGILTVGYVIVSSRNGKKLVLASDTDSRIPVESQREMQNPDLLFIDAWADTQDTAYKLVRELFIGNERETFKYDPNLLYHLLLTEAKDMAEKLNAEMAVGVHIGHLAQRHKVLVEQHETEKFRIGYDMMQIELGER